MPFPDNEVLARLYLEEGQTIRMLAKRYGCRTQRIVDALQSLGISRRPGKQRATLPQWDATKLQQLAKVAGQAYMRQFAKQHGINRTKLAALLRQSRLGRGRRGRQQVSLHDQEIRIAYTNGTAIGELAEHYGCSTRAIGYSLDRTCGQQ